MNKFKLITALMFWIPVVISNAYGAYMVFTVGYIKAWEMALDHAGWYGYSPYLTVYAAFALGLYAYAYRKEVKDMFLEAFGRN